MNVQVTRSSDGEVFILTEDGTAFSYKDGKWHYGCVFDMSELNENQMPVEDPDETQRIYREAKQALERGSEVA